MAPGPRAGAQGILPGAICRSCKGPREAWDTVTFKKDKAWHESCRSQSTPSMLNRRLFVAEREVMR